MKKTLKLEELSIEQKIGMVLTARSLHATPQDYEFIKKMVKNHSIGAIQINPTEENLADLKEITELADYPILIGCDLERGFLIGDYRIPGNMALGAVNSTDDIYKFAKLTAKLAKSVGVNMVWSPVVDCADFDRPCSICRCFGSDRKLISEFGAAYMDAFYDCGVIGSAKHYPSTDDDVDTHMAEGFSDVTLEELKEKNISQFKNIHDAIGDRMTGIMVGHHKCPKIDEKYPASLSKKIIATAREFGFDGLMITDSFAMIGLLQNYGNDKILGLAMDAGNDLILPNYRITFEESYNYLLQNYKDGMFTEERLDEAVSRVLKAQEITLKQPEDFTVTEEEKEMLKRIYDNCICEIKKENVPSMLDPNKKHLFVIDCDNVYSDMSDVTAEINFTKWWNPNTIKERLEKEYPNSEIKMICEFPSVMQVEGVCSTSARCDDVVYLTFCDSKCYQGTDGLTERFRILIKSTGVKNAAILHFGNPYAMQYTVDVPRLIIGFPHEKCIDTALDILAGKKEANGTLPVNIGK